MEGGYDAGLLHVVFSRSAYATSGHSLALARHAPKTLLLIARPHLVVLISSPQISPSSPRGTVPFADEYFPLATASVAPC